MRTRLLCLALVALLVTVGCSKSTSGGSTTPSATTAATAAPTTAMMTTTSQGAMGTLMAQLPVYPGATKQVVGSGGHGSSMGMMLRTPDSFSKVYTWYQSKMPAGSEKSHMKLPGSEMATFWLSSGKKHQAVSIARGTGASETLITLAEASK